MRDADIKHCREDLVDASAQQGSLSRCLDYVRAVRIKVTQSLMAVLIVHWAVLT